VPWLFHLTARADYGFRTLAARVFSFDNILISERVTFRYPIVRPSFFRTDRSRGAALACIKSGSTGRRAAVVSAVARQ